MYSSIWSFFVSIIMETQEFVESKRLIGEMKDKQNKLLEGVALTKAKVDELNGNLPNYIEEYERHSEKMRGYVKKISGELEKVGKLVMFGNN